MTVRSDWNDYVLETQDATAAALLCIALQLSRIASALDLKAGMMDQEMSITDTLDSIAAAMRGEHKGD